MEKNTNENAYIKSEVKTICRGNVHFIKRNVDGTFYNNTHLVLKNNRPFLILSDDKDNKNSRVVTCCPIITREDKEYKNFEMNGFIDCRGMHVFADVSQMTCIPVEHVKSYAYTVPKEKMDNIDRLVAKRLNLNGYIESIVKQYLEDVTGVSIAHDIELDMYVREKKILTTKEIQDILRSRIEQPEIKNNIEQEKELSDVDEIEDNNYEPTDDDIYSDTAKSSEVNTSNKKIKHEKWTKESLEKLIEYCKIHGRENAAKHYNMQKNSLSTLIWRARKRGIISI